ncbi:Zinc finger protein SNAI2 [Armadillidium vulgare]|nr:Zinc finger protein SNAI2 [Armadillidium vulgare]
MDYPALINKITLKEEPVSVEEDRIEESFETNTSPKLMDPLECGKEVADHSLNDSYSDSETIIRDRNSPILKDDDKASSSVNIFEPEIKIESAENIKCEILGSDDDDYNDDDDVSSEMDSEEDEDPDDEDFVVKKSNKVNEREKKYECPLCGKFFLTSSAMNGHVAKVHGTTLGVKFTCHVCGAPGSSRASLKRHLIRTHKLKNVDHPELLTKKCTHCGIGFSSHLLLYEHIRSEHKENLSDYHNCHWCPALMKAKASLQRHIRRVHPEKEQSFLLVEKCPFCEESFSSRIMLQRHLKGSHPDAHYDCNVCNASFKYPYLLTRHKLSHEDPAKYAETRKKRKYSVTCEFCGRKFGSKPRLEYHIEIVHTNPPIKIYTCRMCGLTFPTAKQNNRHYRKVHRPERQKIHCGKCNITFSTREECAEHRALHPNTCDICQKQFLRRDSLREHLLIHSAPKHQCPHCTKKFTQRSNLKRHIRVHTGEKPFKCSFCNRRFSDKSACNSHTRVHTGYERSICSVCGASFSKKQRLNYHMRIHTGEGLLYCPLCMRPSTNSYSLRKHIESHQQPLTKALISIGFKPLLTSDPNFVMRALQAMTHATLQSMSRHENIPNSFMEEIEESQEKGLIVAPSLEKDVEECAEALNDMAKIEGDESKFMSPVLKDDDSDDVPFNLTKFLQAILEKESQKIRIDRKGRREKCNKNFEEDSLSSCMETSMDSPDFDDYDDDDELPSTVGDELVKQCLEIIMDDEASDDDEEICEQQQIKIKTEEINDPLNIKTEICSDFECEETPVCENKEYDIGLMIKTEKDDLEFEEEEVKVNLTGKSCSKIETTESLQEIPKLKISRIAKTDQSSSKDFFVAEIIEKY